MRKLLALTGLTALILLAGCNKEKTPEELLIESAERVITLDLKDPQSAQFRNVVGNATARMVCGEINAKNGMGGYVGFKRFVVAGAVDPATHAFVAGAIPMMEPDRPKLSEGTFHPNMTTSEVMQALDQATKLKEFIDAQKILDTCQRVVPQLNQLEELQNNPKPTLMDRIGGFFTSLSN